MHALAQFGRISRPPADAPRTPWHDCQPPTTGDLGPAGLRTLCEILRGHTQDRSQCWFAVWEGWGELTGVNTVTAAAFGGSPPPPRQAPAGWQLDLRAAKFTLPGRDYYLFTGPLDDALRIGTWITEDWFSPRSPNLWWPDDRSWCVASEIDFDSTLVAGPTGLIDELVHHDDLETWRIGGLDSLAWDGDTINHP
jgi:hypothetical protein